MKAGFNKTMQEKITRCLQNNGSVAVVPVDFNGKGRVRWSTLFYSNVGAGRHYFVGSLGVCFH